MGQITCSKRVVMSPRYRKKVTCSVTSIKMWLLLNFQASAFQLIDDNQFFLKKHKNYIEDSRRMYKQLWSLITVIWLMFLAKMEAFLIVIPKVSKVRHVFELILALHFIFRISSPAIFQMPTSFRMSVISPIFWVIRFEGSFINNFGLYYRTIPMQKTIGA